MIRIGIFGKVFLYTLIFLLITILVAGIVFAQQFIDYYSYLQIRQYRTAFEPLKTSLTNDHDIAGIIKTADSFYDKNQSFSFRIETKEGDIIYATALKAGEQNSDEGEQSANAIVIGKRVTDYATAPEIGDFDTKIRIRRDSTNISSEAGIYGTTLIGSMEDITKLEKTEAISVVNNRNVVMDLDNNLRLRTTFQVNDEDVQKNFSRKVLAVAALLFAFSILGAVILARGITGPIKQLAEDAGRMADLETVSPPGKRRDEVGQLAGDVHRMYQKLKLTISQLESEIKREKEMEENQRYFFSAASHELKTPIAAASALLEGMIEGIGEYKNHTKYLRECLNMMNAQNRTITDILKIVNLTDERIVPQKESVPILSIIQGLLPEYETLTDKKGQRILVNIPEEIYCYTDRIMIGNVISNVMMNAIQNSPEGERIIITLQTDKICRFSIRNTNASIDEEIKEKLFEPFFRADQSRNRGEGRSGLGLTIVKRLLDTLEVPFVLKAEDEDVVFTMELPLISDGLSEMGSTEKLQLTFRKDSE